VITGANSFQATGLLPKCNFLCSTSPRSHGREPPWPQLARIGAPVLSSNATNH